MLASYGASSVLAAPLANALIEHYGVSNAYKILGLMFLCIILVCSFFIESAPVEQTGAKPKVVRHGDKNWRQMLGSKEFYLMFFLLAVGTLPGLMLTANASVIGQDMFQLTASTAAIYVSIYAVANCLGRLLSVSYTHLVPIIASGGAGKMEDFAALFQNPKIDAGLAASIFHFKQVAIPTLKQYLQEQGFEMRR